MDGVRPVDPVGRKRGSFLHPGMARSRTIGLGCPLLRYPVQSPSTRWETVKTRRQYTYRRWGIGACPLFGLIVVRDDRRPRPHRPGCTSSSVTRSAGCDRHRFPVGGRVASIIVLIAARRRTKHEIPKPRASGAADSLLQTGLSVSTIRTFLTRPVRKSVLGGRFFRYNESRVTTGYLIYVISVPSGSSFNTITIIVIPFTGIS